MLHVSYILSKPEKNKEEIEAKECYEGQDLISLLLIVSNEG